MSTTHRHLRVKRGQAAVEMALLGIIVVPVILYTLFLDDLLRFKLNQQEGVVAATWDFTTLNYEKKGGGDVGGNVSHFNRLAYGDHSAVVNAYKNEALINSDESHHKGIGAHECWLVDGAEQIACSDGSEALTGGPGPEQAEKSTGNNVAGDIDGEISALRGITQTGGYYRCKARLGVINNWLPHVVMDGFTKVKMSNGSHVMKYQQTQISQTSSAAGTHSAGTGDATFFFPTSSLGIVTDTWAMTTNPDVSPGERDGILYERVDKLYSHVPVPYAGGEAVRVFGVALAADGLVNPGVVFDNGCGGVLCKGDNPTTPEVAFTTKFDPTFRDGSPTGKAQDFYASQYRDFAGDPVKATRTARKNQYLGKPTLDP